MLTTSRRSAGTYEVTINGVVYIVERMYDWNTCQPTGFWTFREELGNANDIFCSKRDALEALDELTTNRSN